MFIESLTLRGIKSYREEITLTFKEGINFIAGRNGAGKTTIIESIGYLLFWIRPYQYKDLLSTGSKEGFLSLRFRGNDERMYTISRELRKDKCKYVELVDLQTGALSEGEDIVREKIFQIHGLSSLDQLEELFHEIVAVTQGKFTAPFLENGMEKKRKFQRMFGLETYEEAYKLSSPLPGVVKDMIHHIGTQSAHIQGELLALPELLSQEKSLREETQKLTKDEKNLTHTLKEKETLLSIQRDLSEKLLATEKELLEMRTEYTLLKEKVLTTKKDLQKSTEARDICAHTKDSHELYASAEKKSEEYAQILKESDLQRENMQVLEKEETKKIAETTHIRERMGELKLLQETLSKELTSLSEVEEQHTSLLGEKVALQKEEEELRALQSHLTLLEKEYALLQKDEQEQNILLQKLKEEEKKHAHFSSLESKTKTIKEKKNLYLSTEENLKELQSLQKIQQLELTKQEAEKKLLHKGSCPTCGTIGDFSAHMKEKEHRLTEEIEKRAQEIHLLEKKLKELSSYVEEEQILQKEYQSYEISKERMEEMHAKIRELQKPILLPASPLPLPVPAPKEPSLELFKKYMEDLTSHSISHQRELTQKIQHTEQRLEGIKEQRQILMQKQGEYTKCTRELSELQEKDGILKKDLEKIMEKKKELAVILQTYSTAKKSADELLEEMKRLRDAHLSYLAHEKEAERLPDLKALLEGYEKMMLTQEELGKSKRALHSSLEKDFQKELYLSLQEEVAHLKSQKHTLSREFERIKEIQDTLEKKKTHLSAKESELKDLQTQKEQKEKLLRRLDCARGILNQAAEPIAARFRSLLSEKAALFFRRLSSEPSMLIWGEDFEVFLMRSEEHIRKFHQLSGGEQMIAALAIRLALMRYVSPFQIGFFDEPTQNLDEAHRRGLSSLLPHVLEGFHQLFLISHDDTFDSLTDHVIMLEKTEEGTKLVS